MDRNATLAVLFHKTGLTKVFYVLFTIVIVYESLRITFYGLHSDNKKE